MAIEVFNRFENKYLISQKVFEKLEQKLTDYMELDAYNKNHTTYAITNLYYDTPDNHLIRTSLSKPHYKEKLRLRAYGIPKDSSQVYAEIKKKVNGLTNKRRSALELSATYHFMETGQLPRQKPYMNLQVLHEIQYMLERYRLSPVLYVAYDRRAYFGIGEHDLRISFDCNIRSRRTELRLEAGDFGIPLISKDMCLMEVKSARSIPLWLAQMLSKLDVYPTAFSKYGFEYMQMLSCNQSVNVFQFQPTSVSMSKEALGTA